MGASKNPVDILLRPAKICQSGGTAHDDGVAQVDGNLPPPHAVIKYGAGLSVVKIEFQSVDQARFTHRQACAQMLGDGIAVVRN